MSMNPSGRPPHSGTSFRGLAPFLRSSIARDDLQAVAQDLLNNAAGGNAELWMNLSIAMQCLGQRKLGLAIQQQALAMSRIYRIPAAERPARFRLLMLMAPGDLSANTPLECLLERCDIELIHYYVSPGDPLAQPVPDHDALLVAIGQIEGNRDTLDALTQALAGWHRPVINAPRHIHATERSVVSSLLANEPGILIPPTLHIRREALLEIAAGRAALPDGLVFPVLLRPIDSQAGRDLARIAGPEGIAPYLAGVDEENFFLSRFIDYSSPDGLFRKFRIVLIDGIPYACHMAVSSNWMVHYVNAGMYEDAHKRAEEASFLENFGAFARRHHAALQAVHRRIGLDYLCIDCAEMPDGLLLIFEADHAMVVHAMDPAHLFPSKQAHIRKILHAFRDYLFARRQTPRPAER